MHDEATESPVKRRRWRVPFSWLGLFALAWVAYEITHSPGIAAVLICLKFGFEDFLAARWLYLNDLDSRRRRGTFWLYFAWGLWKTAIVAFLMSIGFATIARRPVPPVGIQQVLIAFLGSFLTTLIAFGLSALMMLLAGVYAWWGGYRLWLDSAVYRARRENVWPPIEYCEGRVNRLGPLLITSIAVGFLSLMVGLLTLVPRGILGTVLASVLTLAAPILVVLLREVASQMIWAESPLECWKVGMPLTDSQPDAQEWQIPKEGER